jgi:NADH-quinone oxidoreductase subunit G
MPTVTINGRVAEVEAGTNLVQAAQQVGVQIPHYCYHPRLSVVGQCRMCLVSIQGMPKLQAACSTTVVKDGMVVQTETPEVRTAQNGMMEFFLINHPLDCPICDQAGECGLQDYSFKHGQAFSRFQYEDKRTYPEKERIPLGPHVMLNMNRCIQCTRCIRFTQEVSKTGELGFFERGSHVEIGVFPGKPLDNPLSGNVVDICPVGALTSTRFRFAERVWFLDKKPSLCTACDAGCNITVEHRRGDVKRYKPRYNPLVNDYWMCDHGRGSIERYKQVPRLQGARLRRDGAEQAISLRDASEQLFHKLRSRSANGVTAFLGSAFLTTEEAFLLAQLADAIASPHRSAWVDSGPARTIPNPQGGVTGREAGPNRRGCELVGLAPGSDGIDAQDLLLGEGAARCGVLFVADSDFGRAAYDPKVVERLRKAQFLAVAGWADSPLAQAADLVLPTAVLGANEGTMINADWRLQRLHAAYPPQGEVRPTWELLRALLAHFDGRWAKLGLAQIFELMSERIAALRGLRFDHLPAHGVALQAAGGPAPEEKTGAIPA